MWNPGFILIIVIAVVGMIVQARLQSVFKKYSQVLLELVNYTRKQIVPLSLVEKTQKFFSFKVV